MNLSDAIRKIVEDNSIDVCFNVSKMGGHPAILSHPELMDQAFANLFPHVKGTTAKAVCSTLVVDPYHPLMFMDATHWDYWIIYRDLNGVLSIDVAREWDECRFLVKHKHKPNAIGGLETIDIIQRNKSVKYSIQGRDYPFHLVRERDITRLMDDGDTIENYDESGYIVRQFDTVVKISGIGSHDDLYSIIRKALADHGIIVKERLTGIMSHPEVRSSPEAHPPLVVLHVDASPMPG